jgi:hypothetical protein
VKFRQQWPRSNQHPKTADDDRQHARAGRIT